MNKTQILRVDVNVSTKLLSWDSLGTRTVLKGSFASYGKDFWKKTLVIQLVELSALLKV